MVLVFRVTSQSIVVCNSLICSLLVYSGPQYPPDIHIARPQLPEVGVQRPKYSIGRRYYAVGYYFEFDFPFSFRET